MNTITAKDAQLIKEKINTLAKCKHIKTAKIHGELKRRFNYLSYQMINRYTCKNLCQYLDEQIKADCKSSSNKK